MNKNILILSAGRRVELIKLFNKEVNKKKNIKIFTADSNPKAAPACLINKRYIKLPKCNDINYIRELKKLSSKLNIKVIIPTIDTELLILSKYKKEFEKIGINIVISEYSFVIQSTNKLKTYNLFKKININYPKIYDTKNIKFPIIIKPINGSSSEGIIKIYSFSDLSINMLKNKKIIFQKLIRNHKEYTIDLYYDKQSKLISLIARERLDVRNGEVIKSKTNLRITQKLWKKFSYLSGAYGPITIQIFYNEKLNSLLGIEINPRLGGGCTLSYKCGLNFPKYIITEYIEHQQIIQNMKLFKKDKLLLRYESELITD